MTAARASASSRFASGAWRSPNQPTSSGSVRPCPTRVTRMTTNVREMIRERSGELVGSDSAAASDIGRDERQRHDDGRLLQAPKELGEDERDREADDRGGRNRDGDADGHVAHRHRGTGRGQDSAPVDNERGSVVEEALCLKDRYDA